MSRWTADLLATAFTDAQLPQPGDDEIVIVGRSNAGKSTLINLLFGRKTKKLAHTSSEPGKTRSLNFYRAIVSGGSEKFVLVDLPGYGFAKGARGEQQAWRRLAESYFAQDRPLRFAMHLMDIRHGPLSGDRELAEWLDRFDIPRLVILTKGDKISGGRAKDLYSRYLGEGLSSIAPPVMTYGKNDAAVERLRLLIEEILTELRDLA